MPVGYGELVGGAMGDRDIAVKWGCPCGECCTGGDDCVLEVEVMTTEELLERYATDAFMGLVGCSKADR